MRGAAAAVATCCLIHAGIAGALLGWSVGSWTGALVAAALAVLLFAIVPRSTPCSVTDDIPQRAASVGTEPTR